MRSRLARHAVILSLVLAGLAAGSAVQSASADAVSVPAAIAALLR